MADLTGSNVQAGAQSEGKRKSPQNDIFSTAKSIATKLAPFTFADQLQVLQFVRAGLESKVKAEHGELSKLSQPKDYADDEQDEAAAAIQ